MSLWNISSVVAYCHRYTMTNPFHFSLHHLNQVCPFCALVLNMPAQAAALLEFPVSWLHQRVAVLPVCSSDVWKLGVVAEFGGAQGKACVGCWRGHVWVRRGERRLELMGEGAIAGLVMGVDRWGRKEPVGVVRVSADAQGHLVNYSASLWVR